MTDPTESVIERSLQRIAKMASNRKPDLAVILGSGWNAGIGPANRVPPKW